MIRRIGAFAAVGVALLGAGVVEARHGARAEERPVPAEAVESVRQLLVLLRHYEQSGDPRFLERLPVTPALAAEIADARAWAGHLGERVETEPVRTDVRSTRWERTGVAVVRTREYGVATVHGRGAPTSDPGERRATISDWEYHVVRAFGAWRVSDWTAGAGGGAALER